MPVHSRQNVRPIAGLLVLCAALLVQAPVFADAAKAQAKLDSIRERFGYPGISAAVAVNGTMVWADASGYSDLANKIEATPGTVYRLGSVSKMQAVAAVALLVQERKLDLDAPVQRYVPEYPEKDKGPITTRLLAGHLSGIPHYRLGDKKDTERPDYDNVIAAIAEYGDKPQMFVPGTQYQYSTYGFNLISAVVERAAGKPYPEYMHDAVWAPLGMKNTRVERFGENVPNLTNFYELSDAGEPVLAGAMHVSYKWAGGGTLSTVEDLVRFGSAWLPMSAMFTAETRTLVFTSQRTSDGKETGVGIGWRIAKNNVGRTVYHHSGTIPGGRACLVIRPDDGAVAAVLGNMLGKGNFDMPEVIGLADALLE